MREYYKTLRGELRSAEKDAEILLHASALPGASFFIYYSFGTEADTHALIEAFLKQGKTVCLPRIAGRDMSAVLYTGGVLGKNNFGISEPDGTGDTPCEVALVPLLAVDRAGNRLGYGGGYYDRYFRAHPSVLRIGLCYEGQVVASLPREETDVPLFAVVTENGVRVLGKT